MLSRSNSHASENDEKKAPFLEGQDERRIVESDNTNTLTTKESCLYTFDPKPLTWGYFTTLGFNTMVAVLDAGHAMQDALPEGVRDIFTVATGAFAQRMVRSERDCTPDVYWITKALLHIGSSMVVGMTYRQVLGSLDTSPEAASASIAQPGVIFAHPEMLLVNAAVQSVVGGIAQKGLEKTYAALRRCVSGFFCARARSGDDFQALPGSELASMNSVVVEQGRTSLTGSRSK